MKPGEVLDVWRWAKEHGFSEVMRVCESYACQMRAYQALEGSWQEVYEQMTPYTNGTVEPQLPPPSFGAVVGGL
jgi:hypothetical protein